MDDWKPIETKPDADGKYLVLTNRGAYALANYSVRIQNFCGTFGDCVLYWMEIPEKPGGFAAKDFFAHRCRDCKWHVERGEKVFVCINPKKVFRTKFAKYKAQSYPSCKLFDARCGNEQLRT